MKHGLILVCCTFLFLGCSGDGAEDTYLPEEENAQPLTPEVPATEKKELSYREATFAWITNMQQANGLLESAEYTNFVSLYDNSLAAIAFMLDGKAERAELIFDYFEAQMASELLQGSGGFFQFRDREGLEGSRTWMGDNAWLLIALNQYHELTGTQRYGVLATELESWLRSLQDQDGGLWGGFNEDGSQIPKVTEGIITAFNAVPGYDGFHIGILNFLREQRWESGQMLLLAQTEEARYQYALDLHSLGFLIFEDFPASALHESERYLNTQTATLSGVELQGYGFDEDRDVVWLEGTAQMALAFRQAGMLYKTEALMGHIEKAFIHSTIADGAKGLPYTANYGTHGATPLWDHADSTPALSSSIWYIFAQHNFNPLVAGEAKNLPDHDKFWLPPVQ